MVNKSGGWGDRSTSGFCVLWRNSVLWGDSVLWGASVITGDNRVDGAGRLFLGLKESFLFADRTN